MRDIESLVGGTTKYHVGLVAPDDPEIDTAIIKACHSPTYKGGAIPAPMEEEGKQAEEEP